MIKLYRLVVWGFSRRFEAKCTEDRLTDDYQLSSSSSSKPIFENVALHLLCLNLFQVLLEINNGEIRNFPFGFCFAFRVRSGRIFFLDNRELFQVKFMHKKEVCLSFSSCRPRNFSFVKRREESIPKKKCTRFPLFIVAFFSFVQTTRF